MHVSGSNSACTRTQGGIVDTRRVVLPLLFAVAGPAATADDTGGAAQSSNKHSGTRVSRLTTLPCVIKESGTYVLDRDWNVTAAPNYVMLVIEASNVILDFNGFEIRYEGDGTIVRVEGDNVTLRDGAVSAVDASPLQSLGSGTAIERMTLVGVGGVSLGGRGARFIDSLASGRFGVSFSGEAVVEGSDFGCHYDCVGLHGERNSFTGNRVSAADGVTIAVDGDGNIVARNTVLGGSGGAFEVVVIEGDHNVVRDNTIAVDVQQRPIVSVRGTSNTLDGNIAYPSPDGGPASVGIAFDEDGNFYGDNRMAAAIPFQLGSTAQTDWGGNVGY